jgi:hypothetical protein
MGREEPAVGNEVRKELRLKVVNRRQMRLRAADVEKLIMVPNRLAPAAVHRPGLNLAGAAPAQVERKLGCPHREGLKR